MLRLVPLQNKRTKGLDIPLHINLSRQDAMVDHMEASMVQAYTVEPELR